MSRSRLTEAVDLLSGWIARCAIAAGAAAIVELLSAVLVFPTAASDGAGLAGSFLGIWWAFFGWLVVAVPVLAALDAMGWLDKALRWDGATFHTAAPLTIGLMATLAANAGDSVTLQLFETELRAFAVVGAVVLAWSGLHLARWVVSLRFRSTAAPGPVWRVAALLALWAGLGFWVIHRLLAPPNATAPIAAVGVAVLVVVALLVRALVPRASMPRWGVFALALGWLIAPAVWSRNENAVAVVRGHMPTATMLLAPLDAILDFDADGATSFLGARDCAPFEPSIGPLSIEIVGDGVDQDCRGGDAAGASVAEGAPLWSDCRLPDEPLSVLLLTVDAMRADVLGPSVTPNLAAFAATGALFTRAYAPSSQTGATTLSIFGNRAVTDLNEHSVYADSIAQFEPITSVFEAAGISVGGLLPFELHPGVNASFPLLVPLPPEDVVPKVHKDLNSARLTTRTIDALSRVDRRFFQWTHYSDLHAPYVLREPGDGSQSAPGYLRAARYVDFHLGRVFEFLARSGLGERTVVILSADHGEQLGMRGREGHGPFLFEEAIRVPLVLRVPGCAPRRIDTPTALRHLGPTLGRLLGVSIPGATWFGEASLPVVVEEPFGAWGGAKRAIIGPRYKLIVDERLGGALLFDLVADPFELDDLYAARPEIARQMQSEYQRWLDAPMAR